VAPSVFLSKSIALIEVSTAIFTLSLFSHCVKIANYTYFVFLSYPTHASSPTVTSPLSYNDSTNSVTYDIDVPFMILTTKIYFTTSFRSLILVNVTSHEPSSRNLNFFII